MSKLKPFGINPFSIILMFIYRFVTLSHHFLICSIPRLKKKLPYQVISMGGIHTGGTGKTPMTKFIAEKLLEHNHDTAILSRGYGRISKKNIVVPPKENVDWKICGDEPTMLKNSLQKVWLGIGINRYKNGISISKNVSKNLIFLLDDGFQHHILYRDKDIICLPPNPFSDHLIPIGTLREPISALRRASLLCLIGAREDLEIMLDSRKKLSKLFPAIKCGIFFQEFDCWINPKTNKRQVKIDCKKPLLICAIARPDRFIKMTQKSGIENFSTKTFEDHHIFTKKELECVINTKDDVILTTEKDYIKLSSINLVNSLNIWYLKIKLVSYDIDSEHYLRDLTINNKGSS